MKHISPLFAIDAENLLHKGKFHEVVELCKDGLEVYPDYTAAIALLVKAYNHLNNSIDADKIIAKAKNNVLATSIRQIEQYQNYDLIIDYSDYPNDNSLDNYDNESDFPLQNNFEENQVIHDLEDGIQTTESIEVLEEDNMINAEDLSLIPGLSRFGSGNSRALFSSTNPIDKEQLEKITKKQSDYLNIISSLKNSDEIKPEKSKTEDRRKSSVVVTETIAGILAQQGSFEEAKAAYLELAKKYPDKESYFLSKIEAFDKKLN